MTSRPVLMPACGVAALIPLTVISGCAAPVSRATPTVSRSPSASARPGPSASAIGSNGPIILPQNLTVSHSSTPTAPRVLPPRIVTLDVGQSLNVQYENGESAVQWAQTASGDSRLLGQTTATTHACSTEAVGCAETSTATYTARAAGTTMIRWSFIARGYCPSCTEAIQAIEVTVHQ